MDQPTLSIVVGTLDRPKEIARCVESVLRNTTVPFELLIGDASTKNSPALSSGPVKVFREIPRLGHARGYNALFRKASGKYVCWLNDDAEVMPSWDVNAISFMENTPWVGLGCFYYSERGCCYHIQTYQGFIYANFGILTKEFGDQIGWFDEVVQMYGADNSITFKTILAGKGVAGMPGAKLFHRPINDDARTANMAGQAEDARKLMNKYRPFVWEMQRAMSRFPASPLTTA